MPISQESAGRFLGLIFHWGRNSKEAGFDPWNKIIRQSFHSNDSQIGIFSEPRIPNDSKSK